MATDVLDPRTDPSSPEFDPDFDPELEYVDLESDEEIDETTPLDKFEESDLVTLDDIIDKCMVATEYLSDMPFRGYQREMARRMWESLIVGDGAELTVLCARQTGKSQVIANVLATAMVLLPVLARTFPKYLSKFKRGVWVGVFGPVEDQGATIWSRMQTILTSDRGTEVLMDPEIDDVYSTDKKGEKAALFRLTKSQSICRLQSCNPKARVESKTYHVIVVDEAQDADGYMIKKSIRPMLSSVNGTMIMSGTCSRVKGYFYTQIQANKRRYTHRRNALVRKDHLEWDWKAAAKENADYAEFIRGEKIKIGEFSDEFRMSYDNVWMLSQGMFIQDDDLDALYDKGMKRIKSWPYSDCIVGIDPARSNDSTVVTVLWVNWEEPDEFGYCEHRVLNWLRIHNKKWEDQYYEIWRFLRNYRVARIAVDGQGVGSAVGERLQEIFKNSCEVNVLDSGDKAQTERWVYLEQVMQRHLLTVPGHSKARATRDWQIFNQEMGDAQKVHRGRYMLVAAPEERDAHDDFVDSLCLGVFMSKNDGGGSVVEEGPSPFYRGRGR